MVNNNRHSFRQRNFGSKVQRMEDSKAPATRTASKKRSHLQRPSSPRATRRSAPQRPPWSQQDCRLMQLPAEIRNQIWHEALVKDDGERIDLTHMTKPDLTRTCRQIEAEALPIFFFENRFVLDVVVTPEWRVEPYFDDSTSKWTADAQDRGVSLLIRHVYFTFTRPDQPKRFAMHLLPRPNPHLNTTISFCFAEDQSDFPLCTRVCFGDFLKNLAKEGGEGFTIKEIRRIGREVRSDQMIGMHVCRWFGHARLTRWFDRTVSLVDFCIPDSWMADSSPCSDAVAEAKCKCWACRDERKKARKLARQDGQKARKNSGG